MTHNESPQEVESYIFTSNRGHLYQSGKSTVSVENVTFSLLRWLIMRRTMTVWSPSDASESKKSTARQTSTFQICKTSLWVIFPHTMEKLLIWVVEFGWKNVKIKLWRAIARARRYARTWKCWCWLAPIKTIILITSYVGFTCVGGPLQRIIACPLQ